MKSLFVPTAALLAAAGVAVLATDCDLKGIQSQLEANATIAGTMSTASEKCLDATGIDIFDIEEFPTKAQVKKAQGSSGCSTLINILNGNANLNTWVCNITVEGKSVVYGRLISDFLDGKTGNESDSGSGSVELPSDSDSGSSASEESATGSDSASKASASSTTALSFVAYGVAAAIAAALH